MRFRTRPRKVVTRRLKITWSVESPSPDDMRQLPDGSYVMKDDPDEWPVDPKTGDLLPIVSEGAFDKLCLVRGMKSEKEWSSKICLVLDRVVLVSG
jgi:hypothetical protein